MDDDTIRTRITTLIEREHELRQRRQEGTLTGDEEHAALAHAEAELDQCWDLLRQRRAKREFGQDEETAQPRPPGVVEGYQQ